MKQEDVEHELYMLNSNHDEIVDWLAGLHQAYNRIKKLWVPLPEETIASFKVASDNLNSILLIIANVPSILSSKK